MWNQHWVNQRVWFCSFQLQRTRIFCTHFEYCWAYIDTAWIHKTVPNRATLVFECNIFDESSCVVSVTIRQFATKLLLNSNLRKEKICNSFLAHWIACSQLLRLVNGVTDRCASLFCLFFIAWLAALARELRQSSWTSECNNFLFCSTLRIEWNILLHWRSF